MTQDSKPRRQRADWEAIERDYRTGAFSDQELADKHGNVVTRQGISKRAKEKGWTKDLTAAVRQATKAKVIADEVAARVAKQVADTVAGNVAESCEKTISTVEVIADVQAALIKRHKNDWGAVADTAMGLLVELREAAMSAQDKELLASILAGEGAEPKDEAEARRVVMKALGLGSRVASIKALSDTFTKVQQGQRLAYGLEGGPGGEEPPSSAITDNDKARRFLFAIRQAADTLKE